MYCVHYVFGKIEIVRNFLIKLSSIENIQKYTKIFGNKLLCSPILILVHAFGVIERLDVDGYYV